MISLTEHPLEDLITDLEQRLGDKQSGSFLRFNDGEGKVSGCPEYYPANLLCRELRTHFGNNALTDVDFLSLRNEMNQSFRNADWVGVPPADWPVLFARARPVLENAVFDESRALPRFTHVSFPQMMLERGLFEPILRDRDFLGLVGCRDLRRFFADTYRVRSSSFVSVPEQGGAAYSGYLPPHYPRFAHSVVASIRVPYPGALFLVGAGFCGKLYADAVKRRGGLAIDVGSLMDLWAGRFTRPYMNLDAIVDYYERLLADGDTAPGTFHAVADYHKRKGNFALEEAVIDKAIAENAYLFDFHYRKVELLLRTDRRDQAAEHAVAAVARRRFRGPEVFTIAKAFLNVQDHEQGGRLLSLAFDLDPTYEPTMIELANFYMDRNYSPPADVAFLFDEAMAALASKSCNSSLLEQFARLLGARGRFEEAIQVSNRATDLFSFDSYMFRQRSGWENLLGREDEAARSEHQALRLESTAL